MTTVFLLVAIYSTPSFVRKELHIETMVFETAERCLRNRAENEKRLNEKFTDVEVQCLTKQVETGK
jgi:hypothetical protein